MTASETRHIQGAVRNGFSSQFIFLTVMMEIAQALAATSSMRLPKTAVRLLQSSACGLNRSRIPAKPAMTPTSFSPFSFSPRNSMASGTTQRGVV